MIPYDSESSIQVAYTPNMKIGVNNSFMLSE